MSALVIVPSLALLGCVLWALCAETPAVARHREVGEGEPIGWGPGDEF
ncbi:MAG: hypothetical protein V4597_14580 [Pseudomonadota bacterium]